MILATLPKIIPIIALFAFPSARKILLNNDAMVAAVSLATPAFLFFMAVGMLFGIGGTSLISRLLGQGREKGKILLNELLTIRNGTPIATIRKYSFT